MKLSFGSQPRKRSGSSSRSPSPKASPTKLSLSESADEKTSPQSLTQSGRPTRTLRAPVAGILNTNKFSDNGGGKRSPGGISGRLKRLGQSFKPQSSAYYVPLRTAQAPALKASFANSELVHQDSSSHSGGPPRQIGGSRSSILSVGSTLSEDSSSTFRKKPEILTNSLRARKAWVISDTESDSVGSTTSRLSRRESLQVFESGASLLGAEYNGTPLTDENSGIMGEHRTRISAVAERTNSVIAFRPSNPDCLLPLKYGYPGKSLDIHDKSAKLGPLKGFIPVNTNLNKKSQAPAHAPYKRSTPHHEAAITQLFLYPELLEECSKRGDIVDVSLSNLDAAEQEALRAFLARDHVPALTLFDIRVVQHANPDPKTKNHQTKFVLTKNENGESLVWHIEQVDRASDDFLALNGAATDDAPKAVVVKTEVWAYEKRCPATGFTRLMPTTGDYDLAFTAPPRTLSYRDDFHREYETVRFFHSPHGTYTCTGGTYNLMHLMNVMLESDLVVHGDEMNNEEFSQPIDDNYVIFQPNGNSFLLKSEDLGRYLGMLNKNYVTYINRTWGKLETPSLSGQRLYRDGKHLRLSNTKSGGLLELTESQVEAAKGVKVLRQENIRSLDRQNVSDRRAFGRNFMKRTSLESKVFRGNIYTDELSDVWDDLSQKVDIECIYNEVCKSYSVESSENNEAARP